MNKVTLMLNIIDPSTWEEHECGDIVEFLMTRFPKFPDSGRIYHQFVAVNCDVTPYDEGSIEKLRGLRGRFFIAIYPEPWWVFLIVAIIVAVAAVAIAFLLRPSASPNIKANNQLSSPNNSLSNRQNSERILGRIPDIFGTVQSIPDLIQVPYRIFINSQEVEVAYMCIGRGEYTVEELGSKIEISLAGHGEGGGGIP